MTADLEGHIYYRLSGAGNDFIAFVDPESSPSAEQRRRLCTRGLGLGADGLIVLRPGQDVRVEYYNANGERAELCVNGTRSAAQLAFQLGWVDGEARLETDVGQLVAVHVSERCVRLDAPLPSAIEEIALELESGCVIGYACTVGVPHLVVEVDDLASCDVAGRGAALRSHPKLGAQGANVNFVRFSAGRFSLRTFERGVEAETLACGSGILAATAVGLHLDHVTLPVDVDTRGGCTLRVEGRTRDRAPTGWSLAGDARVVARGEIGVL